jgi:hypothetical protein
MPTLYGAFLVFASLSRVVLTLHGNQQTGEVTKVAAANARLLRSADMSDLTVELDHSGKGRLGALQLGDSDVKASGPQLVNGDFETGCTNKNYQCQKQVDGWSNIGNQVCYIHRESEDFDRVETANGNDYMIGLTGPDSGIAQEVDGHEVDKWYKVIFHAGYRSRPDAADQKPILSVRIDGMQKFSQALEIPGKPTWFEVTYMAKKNEDSHHILPCRACWHRRHSLPRRHFHPPGRDVGPSGGWCQWQVGADSEGDLQWFSCSRFVFPGEIPQSWQLRRERHHRHLRDRRCKQRQCLGGHARWDQMEVQVADAEH